MTFPGGMAQLQAWGRALVAQMQRSDDASTRMLANQIDLSVWRSDRRQFRMVGHHKYCDLLHRERGVKPCTHEGVPWPLAAGEHVTLGSYMHSRGAAVLFGQWSTDIDP